MRDYYTLKEIVFGLRNEQLRVVEKIKELEKYVNIADSKKYKEFELAVNAINELSYSCFVKYNNLLEQIFAFVFDNFNDALKGGYLSLGRVKKEEDGKYIFQDEITLKDEDQETFGIKVNELLKDDFIQNMRHSIRIDESDHSPKLYLSYYATCFYNVDDLKRFRNESLNYRVYKDLISVNKVRYTQSYKDFINEMLSVKIPRKNISEYLQSIIDGNDEAKKDIIIPNTRIYGRKASFYVNEEPNAFVLVRK